MKQGRNQGKAFMLASAYPMALFSHIRSEFYENLGVEQAQWTSLIVFLVLVPLTFFVLRLRFAQPVPESERALTYGLSRKQESLPMEVVTDRADSQGHERT
jgi:hypothetical protein